MTNVYIITVTNNSPEPQTMFLFQQPAQYSAGVEIYTNSLVSVPMSAQPKVGESQTQFLIETQFFAGVQIQTAPPQVGVAEVSSIVEVPIDLSSSSNKNALSLTEMSISGNGTPALSSPVSGNGIEGGAFRIVTPSFNPQAQAYNAGLAAIANGNLVLSNFIEANPNQFIDVQPVVEFYVATGSFTAGTVIDFDSVSVIAALCDASEGKDEFQVIYNPDGTWTVN